MQLIGDKILVEKKPKTESTAAGVIIPVANRKDNEGVVLMVGDKVKTVKQGDKVRFYPGAGTLIDYNGKEVYIMRVSSDVELIL